MQDGKPIKVSSISYKTRKDSLGEKINQIQVHLSNGCSSPLFQAPKQDNQSELKTLILNDSAIIKKIQGTKDGEVIR